MKRLFFLLAGFFLVIPPVQGTLFTEVNLCAQSYPTDTGPVLNCTQAGGFDNASVVTDVTYNVADFGVDYPGSYSGRGYVSMTPDTFRFIGSVDLAGYARKNRVNIDDPFVLQGMVLSLGVMQDTLTVSGPTGVYNINYVLAVDGTFAADPDFFGFFCGALIVPGGTGAATSSFCQNGGSGSVTLSYGNLTFGAPIAPVLQMNILTSLNELMPDEVGQLSSDGVTTLGDVQVNGSSLVDYGSTIHLQSLLFTDANGNPIPGITVRSGEGYTYPVDPRNLAGVVPAPSTLALMAFGLAAFGLRRAR